MNSLLYPSTNHQIITMTEGTEDLYICNGCTEQIPKHRARISCHTCTNYQLCANCFVINQFALPHLLKHSTMVLKLSGFVVPTPPGFPARPAPALPPRRNSALNSPQQTIRLSQLPTANWGALWNVMKGPLEKKEKKPSAEGGPVEKKDVSSSFPDSEKRNDAFSPLSQNPVNEFHFSPPKSVRPAMESFDSTAPSYPRPAKWELLFEKDKTPTPIFVALMSTIFGHLDPQHTGYLSPETYSDFLDVQGYEVAMNLWKTTVLSDGSKNGKDIADLELGIYYSEHSISHTLMIRQRDPPKSTSVLKPSSPVEDRIKSSMRFSANMPMLSRQGFIDLGAREYLRDSERGFDSLVQAAQEYGIWKELGVIPRSMLPEKSGGKGARVEDIKEEDEEVHEKKDASVVEVPNKGDGQSKEVVNDLQKADGSSDSDSEPIPTPTFGSLKLKGGNKVDALLNHEKFDEAESSDGSSMAGSLETISTKDETEVIITNGDDSERITAADGTKEKMPSMELKVVDLYNAD